MESFMWQSAASLLIASIILLPISIEYALITVTVGLSSAVASSLLIEKKRRYLRSLDVTRRTIGVIMLIIILFFSIVVSLASTRLAGPIISCLTISVFLPVSLLPSISKAIAESNWMRFKPKIYSNMFSSIIVGGLMVMFYLGVNIFGVISLLGGG